MCHTEGMPRGSKKPTGPFTEAVSSILRAKIAAERLTQQQVAEAVGLSRAQISNIFSGSKHIDLELLDEICWAIGLSFRDTLVEADEKTEWRHIDPDWTTPTLVRH